MSAFLKDVGQGVWVYLGHVLGLITPGWDVPTYYKPSGYEADVEEWKDDDLGLLVEEGRRQLDRQLHDLQDIRGRAQWLFATGTILLGAIAVAGRDAFKDGWLLPEIMIVVALVFATYGMLGAVAVLVVKADFEAIHADTLSTYAPPILKRLATDFAEMLEAGDNTVKARLTVFRQAIVWVLLGGYVGLVAWLLVAAR